MSTTTSSATTSNSAGWLRRHRPAILVGTVVTAVLVLLTVLSLSNTERRGDLDPDNPYPEGARAVARVLVDQGVEIEVVRRADDLRDAAADEQTTVLVTSVDQLGRGSVRQLADDTTEAGTVVLASPGPLVLRGLDLPLVAAGGFSGSVQASCDDPLLSDLTLDVPPSPGYLPASPAAASATMPCFSDEQDAGALVVRHEAAGDPQTYVLGAREALSNDAVLQGDNAAAALRLLGQHPRLVWYVANARDIRPGDAGSLRAQLPPWLLPGLALVGVAGLAALLWRGRRLGRLAVEPLPVRVPAIESTQGRGRLYRAVQDREHAAAALREASWHRLAERLKLPSDRDVHAIAAAVARATGRQVDDVLRLLAHDPVPDDSALTRLAGQLADIEREVRRP